MIKFYIQAETLEEWLEVFKTIASHPSGLSDQLRNINHDLQEIKKLIGKQGTDQVLIDKIYANVTEGTKKLDAATVSGTVNPA